jgi:hypothetical protein
MVTEAVYNEWMDNLFKMANDGPMSILDHLRKHPGQKMQMGGIKLKSKNNTTFRRRILPTRVVHRRTTQQRVRARTIDTICLVTSAIYIMYNAYNHLAQTPITGTNNLLETLIFNILLPIIGGTGITIVINEILFFLVNFQIPIMVTQSLVNISNSWTQGKRSGLIAAQEISGDLIRISKLPTGTTPMKYRWPTMHPQLMQRGVSVENLAVAFRKGTPTPKMNDIMQLYSQSTIATVYDGPFPTYDELADSTRDYLLKRSLELIGANKRRVMLLAMSTMTRRVVLLLTRPGNRHSIVGNEIGNMFSRMKIKSVSRALPAPSLAEYTQCDKCGNTDEENVVTFSRKCGNCPYDMCDTCYSKLDRSYGYNSSANFKKCPGCKATL